MSKPPLSLKSRKPSVGMLSLGCPKTLVDSELILGQLDAHKYRMAPQIADCDIAFLNTCAFIEDSKKESIDRILELIELKKEGHIKALVVLGCLVQRYPDELMKQLKEVNVFLGTGEYGKIKEVTDQLAKELGFADVGEEKNISGEYFEPFTSVGRPGFMYDSSHRRVALTPKHFRYIKVSEGCDHHCSFCTIPSFRGKHRSRPIEDIIREANILAKEGTKEIVLTGQDTTHYGKDFSGKFLLPDLLQALSQISGIEWIRILYAYPLFVNDKLIEAIANTPKVCHYLDMPLQHISDSILKSMKRGVGKAPTVNLVKRLRVGVPDLSLRTTFIVGYPGETDAEFEELLEFMNDFKFERLGVFTYSQEEDTPAGEMPNQIEKKIKQKRFVRAMELQQKISKENNDKLLGKELKVLIDQESDGTPHTYLGRSYMDAPEVDGMVLVRSGTRKLKPGDFVNAKINGALEYDLTAELVK